MTRWVGPSSRAPAIDPYRARRDTADRIHVVETKDGPALGLEPLDLSIAFVLERLVADGEHLVHEQDVRTRLDSHREPEPHLHSDQYVLRGVSMNCSNSLNATTSSKRASISLRLRPRMAPFRRFLAAREIGMKPGSQFEQRGHSAVDGGASAAGSIDPCQNAEQGALAGPVSSDDRDRLTATDRE